ncbi:MAG TPA: hypothetical protein H9902_16260 [Candidatus Stackebrandtia faecavium]|nr:hypothetical protein [Candidatus Stackebrandtia faecavium]
MAVARVESDVRLDWEYVRRELRKTYRERSFFVIVLCGLASVSAANSVWGIIEWRPLQWVPVVVPGVFAAWAGVSVLFKKDLTRQELLAHNGFAILFVSVPLVLCNTLVTSLIWWVSDSVLHAPAHRFHGWSFATEWDYAITTLFGGLGLQFVAALAVFVVCGIPRYLQLWRSGA